MFQSVRTIAFLVTTIAFLLMLDARVIVRRVFWRSDLERFLNQKAPLWGHGIVNLAKLMIGLKHKDETDKALRAALPAQFVCMSNHQTYLDIITIYDLFPKHQLRFVAKKSLGKHFPGVSQTLRYQRHALIDQSGNARSNYEAITGSARRSIAKGYCPAIFPEGTRSRTGELNPFQVAGVRMIIDQGTLPVVVVAMDGGWKMAELKDYFNKEPKRIRAKILAVLPPPMSKDEVKNMLATAQDMIAAQLAAWRAEA